MCGRFTNQLTWRQIVELYRLTADPGAQDPGWHPRFNAAPTQRLPVVRNDAGGARELVLMRWGLVPFWAKDKKIGNQCINAKAETVAAKPAFRAAFRSRRCLVPADGFYEWAKVAGGKQPYRIAMGNGAPFAFAGLWERWNGEAEPLETFTIVTGEPNELVAPIHGRMPIILDPADYDTWLGSSDIAAAQALLKPFPAHRMAAYPVSSRVSSPRNDDPSLIDRIPLADESAA